MASSSTSSSRRRFFIRLIVFIVLLLALDAGIGSLLRHYYFLQKSGLNYRTTYAVEHSRDEIIILGSSRAQAHYVPSILEQELGKSCYNAGRDGQSLLFATAVHEAILSRQSPDVVILDLILTDFFEYHNHYDRLSALLPYYKSNEAVRPIVRLRSPLERVKLISNIYPFNSLPLQIIRYNLVNIPDDRGYMPLKGVIRQPLAPPKDKPWIRNGLDPNMLMAMRSIVESCEKNHILLYPVISPVSDGRVFGKEAISEIKAILMQTPYKLWNFSDHEDFANRNDLFHDRSHLNNVGAELYTKMVVELIRSDLSVAAN